jgi:Flp pilus assembly protein TadD
MSALDAARERFRAGDLASAERTCREMLSREPGNVDALYLLGMIANQAGRADAAVGLISQALLHRPEAGEMHASLGLALQNLGRDAEAAQSYRRAVELKPDHVGARHNLGVALERMGRIQEAADVFREVVRLAPAHALAHTNLGSALTDLGELDEAIAQLRRGVALAPANAEGHAALASALLLAGQMREGWVEYEWRWRIKGAAAPPVQCPQWDGSPLAGRRVLLWSEQGLGDTLQFVRYAPMVAQRGAGEVVLRVQPALKSLVESVGGVTRCIAVGDALPAVDVHCPLASLPRLFGTDAASIPADVPYIDPPPEKVQSWRERLRRVGNERLVGLCWAGKPEHPNDASRSIGLDRLAAALRAVDGARWISLQKGHAAAQAPTAGIPLQDDTHLLETFCDTAALVANLDLVITVDTSVAHLAGAMARPVWTMIPIRADWRWLAACSDTTPWYPTMRLFRQAPGEPWERVAERVARALLELPAPTLRSGDA